MMKIRFAARFLIAFILLAVNSVAMATQGPPLNDKSRPSIPTEPSEAQPKPESNPAAPPTGSRGEQLYENNCQVCHTSVVHVREKRRARTLKDLEYWVKRWSGELKLQWSADEINDVVDYLNQRYYKIEVPTMQSP